MNWIKAHFECSLQHALFVLRERVEADIEEWHKRAPADSKINVSTDGNKTSITVPKYEDLGPWATFEPKDNYLLVRSGPHQRIRPEEVLQSKLIPTVNAHGECRLRLNDGELEFWQASRFILEALLFS